MLESPAAAFGHELLLVQLEQIHYSCHNPFCDDGFPLFHHFDIPRAMGHLTSRALAATAGGLGSEYLWLPVIGGFAMFYMAPSVRRL